VSADDLDARGFERVGISSRVLGLCVDELVDSSELCPLCSLIKEWLDWVEQPYGVDYEWDWESIIYIFA
jgi:hypothetical protein